MQFKSLVVLASLAVSSFAQTSVAQIETDINNNIAPNLSSLVTAIDNFPTSGGTLTGALIIHTDAINLNNAIVATTNDVKAGSYPRSSFLRFLIVIQFKGAACPVSDSDGQAILADIQALEPNIAKATSDIVARKAAFQALPLGGVPALVQQDLAQLKASTDALAAAFINCSPVRPLLNPFDNRRTDDDQASVVPAAQELQTEIDNDFAPAIAAFGA
ncbi:hypothetical protein C0995_010940 [Termitomyces sp. Mi166|nr:hypothetical protein C0995_010940 [Termitomyces sp. Mi166\